MTKLDKTTVVQRMYRSVDCTVSELIEALSEAVRGLHGRYAEYVALNFVHLHSLVPMQCDRCDGNHTYVLKTFVCIDCAKEFSVWAWSCLSCNPWKDTKYEGIDGWCLVCREADRTKETT